MDTKRTISALVGMVIGLLLGALIITGWNAVRYEDSSRAESDRCWVAGGDYRNGKCEMPVDTRTDEMKVCEAMNGSYITAKDKVTGEKTFTCYDRQGKEKVMPDLTGKEVEVMPSGEVLLRDKR